MAGKQGENKPRDAGKEVQEQELAGAMVSQLETATGHKNLSTGKMAASRADVGKSETSPAHERITAPDIPRVLNFEQQLKEIDDAINRSVSTINSIPN